ncbi:aspartate/glutamate racemase family protein [Brevundimonas sp. Root1279]|uniref:aspartate/glutamate racemase family protein n=1 Tax=Brevundimonas sp. Root1279 TaxID=1736443 RepID=UPI0006F22B3C|nr:amino acid racemase [Brevundimonas sp. Root1279]KQW82883.1 aspartate racemase [Brevundimonas sp. Root1279]
MSKTLGVLGGMGPVATTAFMARVQALTPAKRDEDHLRMLVDLNPHVPNRHTDPAGAERVLGEMAVRLREAGAQVLAMPCNTAHAHAEAIRAAGLPFIDMVEATVKAAKATGARRIGVLATPGGERLYAAALTEGGLAPVMMSEADRAAFMTAVFDFKAGDLSDGPRGEMRRLAAALVGAGAEAVIGGCTEVPLLLEAREVSVPLVDSAEVLAERCVTACA